MYLKGCIFSTSTSSLLSTSFVAMGAMIRKLKIWIISFCVCFMF
jgi:hypothetical protein